MFTPWTAFVDHLGVCLVKNLLTGRLPVKIFLTFDLLTKKLRSTTLWRTQCRAGLAPSVEQSGRRYTDVTICLAASVGPTSVGDVGESTTTTHTIVDMSV